VRSLADETGKLTPPKGALAVEIRPVFTPTMPYSSASATRKTRARSLA
jgi:hypothetical protein